MSANVAPSSLQLSLLNFSDNDCVWPADTCLFADRLSFTDTHTVLQYGGQRTCTNSSLHTPPPPSHTTRHCHIDDVSLLVGDQFTNEILNVSTNHRLFVSSAPIGGDKHHTAATGLSGRHTEGAGVTGVLSQQCGAGVKSSTATVTKKGSVSAVPQHRGTKVAVKPPVQTLELLVTAKQLQQVKCGQLRVILRASCQESVTPVEQKCPPHQQQQQQCPAAAQVNSCLPDDWLVSVDSFQPQLSIDTPAGVVDYLSDNSQLGSLSPPSSFTADNTNNTPLHAKTAELSLLPDDLQDVVLDDVAMLDEVMSSLCPLSPSPSSASCTASLPLHCANTVLDDMIAGVEHDSIADVLLSSPAQTPPQHQHIVLKPVPLAVSPVPQMSSGDSVSCSELYLHSPASPPVYLKQEDQPHTLTTKCRASVRRRAAPYSSAKAASGSAKSSAKSQASYKKTLPADCTDEERRQRKRLQNKLAATRYRQKKREEMTVVACDEDLLESRNRQLKERVHSLTRELDYLRKLMREVLKHKQVI